MEPPKLQILTDPHSRKVICRSIEGTNLPWRVLTKDSEYFRPDIIFADVHNIDIVREKRRYNPNCLAVGVGSRSSVAASNAFNRGIINPLNDPRGVSRKLDEIVAQDYEIGLNVAIVGIGDYTKALAPILRYNAPHIRRIKEYSFHLAPNYEGLREVEWEKRGVEPEYCDRLEDVFKDSDLVLVLTGRKDDTNFNGVNGEKDGRANGELIKRDLRRNASRVCDVYSTGASENFNGLYVTLTSPTAENMEIARERFGIPAWKHLSTPHDSGRVKRKIAERVSRIRGFEEIDWRTDIYAPVVDRHEKYFPLFDMVTVKGVPLYKVDPIFSEPAFQKDFLTWLWSYPPRLMAAAKGSGFHYEGTPGFTADVIKAIAHGRPIKDSLTIWVDRFGTFTNWQGRLDYGDFMTGDHHSLVIEPDPNFNPKLPKEIEESILENQRKRKKLIEEVLHG